MATSKEIRAFFIRGREITLADGQDGVFLECCKGTRDQAWVLVGGLNGPKRVDSMKALVDKNIGDES